MNNIFQSNSRFAVLSDDFKEVKKEKLENKDNSFKSDGNSFKSDGNSFKSDGNSFKSNFNDRNKNYSDKLEKKLKEEERIKSESLAPESFPALVKTKTPTNITNSISFLDKLQTVAKDNTNDEIDLDYENLKPGWMLIKHDISTGETIIKSKHIPLETSKPVVKTENEIIFEGIDALVKLNQKRTDEYIDLYGYDTWEKMFIFPNHDYEYFDKLDEIYYEELEKEQQLQDMIDMQNNYYTERDIYFGDKIQKVDHRSIKPT